MKRLILLMLLHLARRLGLFALARYLTRHCQRILCYHGIWMGPPPHYGECLFMSATRFEARMNSLRRAGYRAITLDEACRRLRRNCVQPKDVVITIDDAWRGTGEHMVPVLHRLGWPSTLYVTTYYVATGRPVLNVMLRYMVDRASRHPERDRLPPAVSQAISHGSDLADALAAHVDALPDLDTRWAEVRRLGKLLGVDADALAATGTFSLMSPEALREAQQRGMDLQLHTHTHRMHGFDPQAVAHEVALNRQHLAVLAHRPPEALCHFCFPSGEHHASVLPTLRACGVESATTTRHGLAAPDDDPLTLARVMDGESFTDIELEARLSGFWQLLSQVRGTATPPIAEHSA